MVGTVFLVYTYINICISIHTVRILGLMGEKIQNIKNKRKPIKPLF